MSYEPMKHLQIRSLRLACVSFLLLFYASGFVLNAGCRTASSLGLPVSSGSHALLSSASKYREQIGHPGGVPTELAKAPLPPHRMEAGDALIIEPNDFNSPVRFPSDQTVQQDGTIDLGSYGKFLAAGKTTEEIQREVQFVVANVEQNKRSTKARLASLKSEIPAPQDEPLEVGIAVRLINRESGMYYVMGDVNAPGSYPLNGHETVLDAIIAAGGLTSRANDHKIILTRPQLDGQPRIILPVCYQQILQMGDVTTNYQLLPGDRIYVPSLTIWEDVKQTFRTNNDQSCPHCRKYVR